MFGSKLPVGYATGTFTSGMKRLGQPTTPWEASGKPAQLFGCPFGSANLGDSIESARVRV